MTMNWEIYRPPYITDSHFETDIASAYRSGNDFCRHMHNKQGFYIGYKVIYTWYALKDMYREWHYYYEMLNS